DESYTITWNADDEDGDTVTIDLYYDMDMNPDNGKTLIESGLDNTGSYDWATSDVDEGDYYIYGIADDNNGSQSSDYSDGKVSISHGGGPVNHAPSIEITEPDGNDDDADESYTITWNADDEDGDTVTIDLYYDTDTDPDNGKTEIESGLDNTGSYDWDTSDVDEGNYYIHGIADDNNGSQSSDYSNGKVSITHYSPPPPTNHAPQIEITEPDGNDDEADETFTIQWTASDEDGDTVTIELYYDTDTNPDNGKTLIASDLSNTESYDWDTSEIDEGEYYIYAMADDNNGSQVGDYSSGTVHISHPTSPPPENHPPKITIFIQKTDNYTYSITWVALDPDGDALEIDLFYDSDKNPDNGKTLIAKDLSNIDIYSWDISFMEDGNYYILGVAKDGKGGETGDYSSKTTISLPKLLPDFAVISLDIQPPAPTPGNTVILRATIQNQGTASGSGTLEFRVDGISIATKTITLRPGQEKTLTAVWTAVEGNHTIMVGVSVLEDSNPGNNEVERVVSVAGAQGGKEKDGDDDFPVLYVGSVLAIVVGVVGGVAVYRKKGETSGVVRCPGCGSVTTYSGKEDDYYCWECEEYVGEMGEGEIIG
ncbi:MAG: hypothetical protein KAU14_09275, partial [Thermoplasmata archaeon]|nr:hypothetical protein [Thermoplasmata archaeon]